MGPKIKFYWDGVLKIWNWGDFLRRDDNYNAIDRDGTIFVPRIPQSEDDLVLADKLWIKLVDDGDVGELYKGDELILKYDRVGGNLIFGFNDINILPIEKGGTGVETLEEIIELLGLKEGAFLDEGTNAGELLKLTVNGQLPALDGSLLTGITNIPAGMFGGFGMTTAPTGWLKCNGAQVSRTTYANLFAAIGTIWGEGNGTTTFTLPDARGEFFRGWDDGRGVDVGRAFGSFQTDMIKAHRHGLRGSGGSSGPQQALSKDSNNNSLGTSLMEDFGGVETRGRNITELVCIKY